MQFFAQQGEHGFHSGLAEGGEGPEVGAADADGAGAHGEGFEEIGAATEAAIDEHFAIHGGDDFGQAVDAGAFAVLAAAAVIGDDEAVRPVLQRECSVLLRDNSSTFTA